MNTLKIHRDSQGDLELTLTEDEISYADFPKWCREFLKRYGGKRIEKIDGPDCRVQIVRLLGQELKLVFFDYPLMTCLIAESSDAEVVLGAIGELESDSYQDSAANGSQPIRSETNPTSSAAGSRPLT